MKAELEALKIQLAKQDEIMRRMSAQLRETQQRVKYLERAVNAQLPDNGATAEIVFETGVKLPTAEIAVKTA